MEWKKLINVLENGGKIKGVKMSGSFPSFYEDSADPGMICDFVGISLDHGCCYKIEADFSPYEQFNRSIAKKDWVGKNNESVIWMETSFYENGKEVLYIDYWRETKEENDKIAQNVIDNCFLFDGVKGYVNEYLESGENISYVEWLENQLDNCGASTP